MNRDAVKTFIGLVIIGGIVVATFLYGNSQRQAQLAHDQDVKRQQAAKSPDQAKAASPVASAPAASAAPTKSATPMPSPTPTPQVAAGNNTAPVKSPTSNSLQGSGGSGTPLGASTTASPAVTTTPVAGATGAGLPETGPGTMGMIGVGAIAFMLLAVRGSRRAIFNASRTRR